MTETAAPSIDHELARLFETDFFGNQHVDFLRFLAIGFKIALTNTFNKINGILPFRRQDSTRGLLLLNVYAAHACLRSPRFMLVRCVLLWSAVMALALLAATHRRDLPANTLRPNRPRRR